MEIRRYRPATPGRVVLYLVLPLVVALVCARAIIYNDGDLPIGAWVAMAATVGSWFAICGVYWHLRFLWARQIVGYTSGGVALVVPLKSQGSVMLVDRWREEVDLSLRYSLAFWGAVYNESAPRMAERLNGAALFFSPKLLQPHGVWEAGRLVRWAVGLTTGRDAAVTWAPGEPLKIVLPRVKHETGGHVLLNAAGIPTDQHHSVFAEKGWNV